MIPDVEYLIKHFHIYNDKYFYSMLPLPKIVTMRQASYLGYYYPPSIGGHKIAISVAYEGDERFFQNTLIHEMIHYYLNFIDDEDTGWCCWHGPKFRREAARINRMDGWNIKRCATEEEMAMVKRVYFRPRNTFSTRPIAALINNPPMKQELVDYILTNRSKKRDVRIWLSYRQLQQLIYDEASEDDVTEEWQERRHRAIRKGMRILLRFNQGNSYNLFVLHNDLEYYYRSIGNTKKADEEALQTACLSDSVRTLFVTHRGNDVTPIKAWGVNTFKKRLEVSGFRKN